MAGAAQCGQSCPWVTREETNREKGDLPQSTLGTHSPGMRNEVI